jgi:hypothetical protein
MNFEGSPHRLEYESHLKSMYAARLPEYIRDKMVKDVMRFPEHRKEDRLTYLIKKLDRDPGMNEYDVDSILQKLKARGVTHGPNLYETLVRLLQIKYGKSRKRRKTRSKGRSNGKTQKYNRY